MPRPGAKKIKFGDWLPDLPDLDNPGLLVALNVRPVGQTSAGYQPYNPIMTSGNALTTAAPAAVGVVGLLAGNAAITPYIYVGTPDGKLYVSLAGSGTWTDYSGAAFSSIQSLCQYNTLVICADGQNPLGQQTIQSGSNFASISGAPAANVVGVIGQFLLGGNINQGGGVIQPHLLQWSGIGAPTNWPTPQSAAAIAAESGEQFLHLELGPITGIFGADQWGVVLQSAGITRVSYLGGQDVFDFDTLSTGLGMDYQNAGVKAGNAIYFPSKKGFYATDGVNILPIGEEKVNRWFVANVVPNISSIGVRVSVDWTNKIIVWAFPPTGGGLTTLVFFNFETNRFAYATDANVAAMIRGDDKDFATYGVQAIGQDKKLGTFTGAPGTASITSAEVELNPGGKTFVQGFLPQVTGSSSITCQVGSRMKQSDAIAYTALTPNPTTGYQDGLIEANYHRVQTNIAGSFTQAIGGDFLSSPAGAF